MQEARAFYIDTGSNETNPIGPIRCGSSEELGPWRQRECVAGEKTKNCGRNNGKERVIDVRYEESYEVTSDSSFA